MKRDSRKNLLEGMSNANILGFLLDFYPNGFPEYQIKFEGRSVKYWQKGRRVNWNRTTQGKWVVLCPLKDVKLYDIEAENGLELQVANITIHIR